MPIYEYRCQDCGKVSGFLILSRSDPFTPVCRGCGGANLTRILSRVHVRLSEETRFERLASGDLNLEGLDEKDPAGVARVLKKMGPLMGDDFSPEEVDQMVEEAAAAGEDGGAGEEESD